MHRKNWHTCATPSPAIVAIICPIHQLLLCTMKLIKLLRGLLVLWLFTQADTQTVTVTIGESESGSRVFIEWFGSFKVLPPTQDNFFNLQQNFISGPTAVYLAADSSLLIRCKFRTDVMDGHCQFCCSPFIWMLLQPTQEALILVIFLH